MNDMARKDELGNLDIYVKWPQLEDAISISPGSSRPTSGRLSDTVGSRPESARPGSGSVRPGSGSVRPGSGSVRPGSGSARPISASSMTQMNDTVKSLENSPVKTRSDSNRSNRNRTHRSSRDSLPPSKRDVYQPSENVIKRLNELGMLAERQNDLMDALEVTRVSLTMIVYIIGTILE